MSADPPSPRNKNDPMIAYRLLGAPVLSRERTLLLYDYDLVGRVHFRFGFLNYAHCAVNATPGPPASRTRTSNTQVLGTVNVSGSTPPKHINHQSAHISSPTSVRSLRHRVCVHPSVLSGVTALAARRPFSISRNLRSAVLHQHEYLASMFSI